jgi:hypothetical protein
MNRQLKLRLEKGGETDSGEEYLKKKDELRGNIFRRFSISI